MQTPIVIKSQLGQHKTAKIDTGLNLKDWHKSPYDWGVRTAFTADLGRYSCLVEASKRWQTAEEEILLSAGALKFFEKTGPVYNVNASTIILQRYVDL